MKMNRKFNVNVLKLIDKKTLDGLLEKDMVEDENNHVLGMPKNISHHCITITRDGLLTLDSRFEMER